MAKNSYTLAELAGLVGGTLHGVGSQEVSGICSIEEQQPGKISFISSRKIVDIVRQLKDSPLAAVLLGENLKLPADLLKSHNIIFTPQPLVAMVKLVPLFYETRTPDQGVSVKADIHPTARLGQNVKIGAFCSIGPNVVIGDDTIIYPHVTVYADAVIGQRVQIHSGASIREHCVVSDDCIIQNGAVIGADGFGYYPDERGSLKPVPQIGITVLDKSVDIGANSCIDRAAFGTTRIGQGTKIDNLVQIGHNVQIGKSSILCGHVAVGGSTKIGNYVTLAGKVGVNDHINIADGTRVGGASVVDFDLKPGEYMGAPILTLNEWKRVRILSRHLGAVIKSWLKENKKG